MIMAASPIDEFGKLLRALCQILKIKFALPDATKKAWLAVLQDVAAQRQKGSAWRYFCAKIEQVILATARAMKQQQRSSLWIGPFNKPMDVCFHEEAS